MRKIPKLRVELGYGFALSDCDPLLSERKLMQPKQVNDNEIVFYIPIPFRVCQET